MVERRSTQGVLAHVVMILGVLTLQAMKQRADDVFQQVADPSAR